MTGLTFRGAPHAKMTETSLFLPSRLPRTEWKEVGEKLAEVQKASAWWIGDWINYGERKWGEIYAEAERITGLSYQYLAACSRVARRYQFNDRSLNLSWSHHLRIASRDDRLRWLRRAEEEGWTWEQMIAAANEATGHESRIYYGRGDRFWDALKPLRLYQQSWQEEKFSALNPAEAEKRLQSLLALWEELKPVRDELSFRAQRAGITARAGVIEARRRTA